MTAFFTWHLEGLYEIFNYREFGFKELARSASGLIMVNHSNILTLQKVLGHSDIKMTSDTRTYRLTS